MPHSFVSDRFAVFTTAQALILTAGENWVIRGRGSPFDIDLFLRLCQCHDAVGFDYIDNERSEGKSRIHHRLEWLCITKARRVLLWQDYEVVRCSRKDRVHNQYATFELFLRSGLHLDIGCYPEATLLFVDIFAPPEGLSLPPLMTLRFYACHMTRLSSKTIEISRRRPDYFNQELARLIRMLMVEYAWAIIVCAVLESQRNNRVPVLSVPLVMLVE